MSDKRMNRDRVRDIIAAYGAEPGGWPEAEREAANAEIAASPEAFADLLAEARGIDAALSGAHDVKLPAGLADRILANAPRPRRRWGAASPQWPRFRWPAGAVFASLVIGLVSGYASAANGAPASYDAADTVYARIFAPENTPNWLAEEDI